MFSSVTCVMNIPSLLSRLEVDSDVPGLNDRCEGGDWVCEEGECSSADNVGGASMAGSGCLGMGGGRPVATCQRKSPY